MLLWGRTALDAIAFWIWELKHLPCCMVPLVESTRISTPQLICSLYLAQCHHCSYSPLLLPRIVLYTLVDDENTFLRSFSLVPRRNWNHIAYTCSLHLTYFLGHNATVLCLKLMVWHAFTLVHSLIHLCICLLSCKKWKCIHKMY